MAALNSHSHDVEHAAATLLHSEAVASIHQKRLQQRWAKRHAVTAWTADELPRARAGIRDT